MSAACMPTVSKVRRFQVLHWPPGELGQVSPSKPSAAMTWSAPCEIVCACLRCRWRRLGFASVNPASFPGVDTGRLAAGYRAGMIALDPDEIRGGQGMGCRQRNMSSERMRKLR